MLPATPPLDVLFFGELALWPLDQGSRVHGYNMARGLQQLGLRVGITTVQHLPEGAPGDLRNMTIRWPVPTDLEIQAFG